MIKYSDGFERDFNFYFRMRKKFWFSGSENRKIIYDRNGLSAKEAFHKLDSIGEIVPTKHPNLLASIIKSKESANWHIKRFKEDRQSGLLCKLELQEILAEFSSPEWFNKICLSI